jgi:predicted amidophosphoribosyltransferase
MGIFKSKAYWIRQEHLFGKDSYICSKCKLTVDAMTPVCPKCKSEMKKKAGYDPVFIDEMEDYD